MKSLLSAAECLRRPILEMRISVRSANCLKNMGITRVVDLIQRTEEQMLGQPNFGRTSLHELRELLAQMGLHFGMVPPDPTKEKIHKVVVALRLEADSLEQLADELSDLD